MLRTYILLLLVLVALVGCSTSPSDADVQTAIAQTAVAPTIDPSLSSEATSSGDTPQTTNTPKPRVSCPDDETEGYLEEMGFLLEEWDDTVEIAGSTSRVGLSPVISELQNLKREGRRLDRPECATYLQDLITLAMESEIEAFLAFLSQESDTVVARMLESAEKTREIVDNELVAFQNDPVTAYQKSTITAEALKEELEQAEPFVLPGGWTDVSLPATELYISVPNDWEQSIYGDANEYLSLKEPGDGLSLLIGVFPDFTELESDAARLFSIQTALESDDNDFYLEHEAEIGVYAENKGYVVEYSVREESGDDIEEEIRANIVTPNNDEILLIITTDRDEFIQIDLLTLAEIYASIRQAK